MISVGLFCQTGLFELTYGDNHETVKSILLTAPYDFEESVDEEFSFCYTSPTNQYVDRIICYFDTFDDKLVSWRIYYADQEEEDIKSMVLAWAQEVHEADPVWDDAIEGFLWDLGEGKVLYLTISWDDYVIAEYYNDEYFQFSDI